MNELIQINHEDYKIEERKAQEIADMFKPMLDKMVELENEFNTLVKEEITTDICKKAKELRLKYVKTRTGTKKIHKCEMSGEGHFSDFRIFLPVVVTINTQGLPLRKILGFKLTNW